MVRRERESNVRVVEVESRPEMSPGLSPRVIMQLAREKEIPSMMQLPALMGEYLSRATRIEIQQFLSYRKSVEEGRVFPEQLGLSFYVKKKEDWVFVTGPGCPKRVCVPCFNPATRESFRSLFDRQGKQVSKTIMAADGEAAAALQPEIELIKQLYGLNLSVAIKPSEEERRREETKEALLRVQEFIARGGEMIKNGEGPSGMSFNHAKGLDSWLGSRGNIEDLGEGIKLLLGWLEKHDFRLALLWVKGSTLQELGQENSLTSGRVNQIIAKAMRLFRGSMEFRLWRDEKQKKEGPILMRGKRLFFDMNDGKATLRLCESKEEKRRKLAANSCPEHCKKHGYMPLSKVLDEVGLRAHDRRKGISPEVLEKLSKAGIEVNIITRGAGRYYLVAPDDVEKAIAILSR